ncbi:hypothetical protein [Hyalangium rubrum]|uniref:Outer membrane protein beta-barrel domain-containing protein n=1 Tax=Hyalangium rubrum TaxID=3103134 RepID=A0ABU5H9U9_9BACT|nr:hypothetical protein [Hyalangium sp. s54d21]MDY7230267.1 hypothetical protein [Hyalangium sp. s54d21]
MRRSFHALALLPLCLLLSGVAWAEEPPEEPATPKVALDFGATLSGLRHPAATLPPSPGGFPRSVPDRDAAARLTFGVQLALSQFFPSLDDLWQTNLLDWYLSGGLQIFSLRIGGEQQLALSRWLALGLGVHGAVAEVSIGTGEFAGGVPPTSGDPTDIDELRASQWLFGAGGTVSLLLLTRNVFFARLQAGYTVYLPVKARNLEAPSKDFTPPGFSVSLGGPSIGAFVGIRL